MDFGLKDAAVLISGGTQGMGREAALGFAREGARVAVTARTRADLDALLPDLRAAGAPDVIGLRCDVGSREEIDRAFAEIGRRWDGLNTLVNMVGPTRSPGGNDFMDIPDENWQWYFDIGIMSVVRCTRAAVPLMRKAGWGRVINISSIMARVAGPGEAPYMAAKSGLGALSKNIAWTLAKEGILVNTVTPGAVHTPAIKGYMQATGAHARYDVDDLADVAGYLDDLYGGRVTGAIGRVGGPEEIVPLLLLLGSKANGYIVGADIPMDGGTDYSTG
jgi:NAD(P)-dependent dehydrogenase (short-subunit alcohol dehydrogenase family)